MIGTNRSILQFIVHLALILMAGIFAVAARASELNDEIKWIHEEVKSDIVSSLGLSMMESPGSIQILTKQEFDAMGARDLSDIIRTLSSIQILEWPGYWLDSPGIHGMNIGTRLYIDNHEITDLTYGLSHMGRFLPIQNIERIEIITGGAASLKGGGWSSCVINVVLDKQKQNTTHATMSTLSHGLGAASLNHTFSDSFADWDVYLQAARNNTRKSDRILHATGSIRNYEHALFHELSAQSELIDLTLKKDNLEIQAFSHSYEVGQLNAQFLYMPNQVTLWRNQGVAITWRQSLLPEILWNTTMQYNYFHTEDIISVHGMVTSTNPEDDYYGEGIQVAPNEQKMVTSELLWQPNATFGLTLGGHYSIKTPRDDLTLWQKYIDYWGDPDLIALFESQGTVYKTIEAKRVFGELLYRSPLGLITAGGSIDKYSTSKMSQHPRFSYSKKFGSFYLKASYQEAFQNAHPMDTSIFFEGELIDSTQKYITLEGLYLFSPDNYIRTVLTDQVSYGYYSTRAFGNFRTRLPGELKQQFLDFEYMTNSTWGQSNFGFTTFLNSWADPTDYPGFVPPNGAAPGAAKTKVSFRHIFQVGKDLTIAPSLYYLSERYGVRLLVANMIGGEGFMEPTGEYEYLRLPPCLVMNLNLTYKTDLFRINAGIFNITNADEQRAHYESQNTEVEPGTPREFNISVAIDW